MPSVETPAAAPTEGWQAEGTASQRRWHYIRNHDALCGKFGFYFGELSPGGLKPGTPGTDCAECVRRVDKEIAKAAELERKAAALAAEASSASPTAPSAESARATLKGLLS